MTQRKMDPEKKAKWVAALRSGEYVQGRNLLEWRDAGGRVSNCCLGVLCRLAIADGVPLDTVNRPAITAAETDAIGFLDVLGRPNFYSLPPAVADWAGLVDGSPAIPAAAVPDRLCPLNNRGADIYLSQVNDDEASTFAIIADLIEENL